MPNQVTHSEVPVVVLPAEVLTHKYLSEYSLGAPDIIFTVGVMTARKRIG